jgi:diaminohydroxyphosphoribosylaminopyrimidine deaminase/5-amino-6-(5-phosphoribosylamino)uracil reductase
VVAAVRDPDPDARGGVEILKRAGIDTHIGLLAEEAAAQNAPFLSTRQQTDRPFVALKLATSIDGRIADSGGSSQWISGAEAREHVHWLRAGFDAIAVGGTTALTDNPQLTARGGVRRAARRSASCSIGARCSILACRSCKPRAKCRPGRRVAGGTRGERLRVEANGVRVFRPNSWRRRSRSSGLAGIQSLLCEGGGALGTKLLAEGLVDRLYWVQAPVWLGEGAVPAFPGIPAYALADAPRWVVVERRALGTDTLLVLDRKLCLPE